MPSVVNKYLEKLRAGRFYWGDDENYRKLNLNGSLF